MTENSENKQLSAGDTAQAAELLITKAKEKLGLGLKKVRLSESFVEGENIDYITAELLPYSRGDAKRLSGEGSGELLAQVSEILADILRDALDVNAMVGCVAAYGSYEDIYRAKLYAAFDESAAAQRVCIEYASDPLIASMSIENGTALCVFDSKGAMDEFRENSAARLNAEIVRRLIKADKLGFVDGGEIHVILSVR